MTTFILILFVGSGFNTKYEANALTTAEFSTKAKCDRAGFAAESAFSTAGTKKVGYVCVEK